VALARALAPQPTLLDEPLSNLMCADRGRKCEILKATGTFGNFVTHDQEEALSPDQVAVMRQGRLEQIGTPEDTHFRLALCGGVCHQRSAP